MACNKLWAIFCVMNDPRRMFYTVFLAKKSRSSHVNLVVLIEGFSSCSWQ